MPHPASLKTAGRAGRTGCQRKAPLSSHCSLDSEGGEAAQSSRLCSEIWATTALMPCLCQGVTLHVQDTQTRSVSAAHQRNKTSEYLQQTQVLS